MMRRITFAAKRTPLALQEVSRIDGGADRLWLWCDMRESPSRAWIENSNGHSLVPSSARLGG